MFLFSLCCQTIKYGSVDLSKSIDQFRILSTFNWTSFGCTQSSSILIGTVAEFYSGLLCAAMYIAKLCASSVLGDLLWGHDNNNRFVHDAYFRPQNTFSVSSSIWSPLCFAYMLHFNCFPVCNFAIFCIYTHFSFYIVTAEFYLLMVSHKEQNAND